MKRLLIAMAAMVAMSGVAQAQDIKPYVGVGAGAFGLEYTEPGFNQKSTTFGGFVKLGVDVNEYVGAELRLATTSKGSKSYPAGTLGGIVPFDFSLTGQSMISYLAKLQFPVAQDFRVYGLIGGTTGKLKRELSVPVGGRLINDSATKTGFSYGFGGEYFVADHVSVGGEWIQYWTDVNLGTGITGRLWSATGSLNYHF
ncbi:MAG: porin family protein [Mariprofundus sp.]